VCHAIIHFPYLHAKKGPGEKDVRKAGYRHLSLAERLSSQPDNAEIGRAPGQELTKAATKYRGSLRNTEDRGEMSGVVG
jgi:hypothetical protein